MTDNSQKTTLTPPLADDDGAASHLLTVDDDNSFLANDKDAHKQTCAKNNEESRSFRRAAYRKELQQGDLGAGGVFCTSRRFGWEICFFDYSQFSTRLLQNYGSLDSLEPTKFILEKDQSACNSPIVAEIDKTVKKHADNLLHVLEGVSVRLTQLESRTRLLEESVDDLKTSVGNNHGNTDGKMRQLENILREFVVECEGYFLDRILEKVLDSISRSVEGIIIAHSGRSVVNLFRFGEMAMSHTKTQMEEAWTIEELPSTF
ncbi:hypothetical protein CsatB_003646 [Cannabis sativa]